VIVRPAAFHDGPQVLAELFQRGAAYEPPAVVDPMNGEVGVERERVRQGDEAVLEPRSRDLDDVQARDGLAVGIAQEGVGGAETGAEGGDDLRSIGRDDGQPAVVDGELILQPGEVP
jgi:hypothetical protein